MTEAKHTPGPWTQGWSKNGIDCVWLDGKTEPAIGMGDDDDWIDCVTEANARLIAAAPDMLQRLEMCKRFLEDMHTQSPEVTVAASQTLHETVSEIIAQATGK